MKQTDDLKLHTMYGFLLIVVLLVSGCQMANPPRLATATAQAAQIPTPTPEKLILTIDQETAVAETDNPTIVQEAPNPTISVWVNETSTEHKTALAQMADEFTSLAQVDVEIMFVPPLLMPDLVNTAVLSGTLPDIIIHPLEYTSGWVENGILNPTAADTAVTQIGASTFDPAALELMTIDGQIAAIPSDGYYQLLIYRTDWFEEANLAIPDNYTAMFAAAETTTDRDNQRAGFVIPTEANLFSTYQTFEQIALANDCQLIDEKGEVLLLEPACVEALDFYYTIVNQFSPIGVQTNTSTDNAYLAGRTGLIMTSPSILPQLANNNLAENSGILTEIRGQNRTTVPSSFGHITNVGITTEADIDTAVTFANYWFNEGYEKWLAVSSERKVPMRLGTVEEPQRFIEAWGTTPLSTGENLTAVYGEETISQLRDGIAQSSRWGITQGQGSLITDLYDGQTLSITLQEMLSGYFNPEQTIIEAYNRVTDLIPNYQYHRDEVETEQNE